MIEIRNLSFAYGKTEILKNIGFSAKPGEITALIGANGAGKSTILKCIAGLEKGKGSIRVCGVERDELKPDQSAALIGYLRQNAGCHAELNVYEVILLGLVNQLSFRVSEADMARVENVMKLMSISRYAGRKISELSGGQQQLVFIAQTLIKKPEIIMMDEPASALDPHRQFKLMELLKSVTRERQFTTLLTLHHLDLTAGYADKVVVIKDGTVYREGTPERVFTEHMMKDVYQINAEIYIDKKRNRHLVAVDAIDR